MPRIEWRTLAHRTGRRFAGRGQLDGASLRPLELTPAPDTLSVIDAIFPGPGGTAPEADAR